VEERKCLVFGGAGPIGASLCSTLLRLNWKVFAVDSERFLPTPAHKANLNHSGFTYKRIDLSTLSVEDLMGFAPDCEALLNFCGPARYTFYIENPTATINSLVESTQLALQYCAKVSARLIQASSSEIYGSAPTESYFMAESSGVSLSVYSDRAIYSGSKFISEALIQNSGLQDFVICRLFNVYGPNYAVDDTRVIPAMVEAATSHKTFRIYGDGKQTRSYLFIDDLLAALVMLIDTEGKHRLYNIGNTESVSVEKLWFKICELTGADPSNVVHLDVMDSVKFRRPSIRRIAEEIGWTPTVDINEGLSRCLAPL
jgi:UDP-glucuronate decarboxylase